MAEKPFRKRDAESRPGGRGMSGCAVSSVGCARYSAQRRRLWPTQSKVVPRSCSVLRTRRLFSF